MIRVAAVDLGTNSTRLLVADVEGEQLSEVSRRLTITRLGEGVDLRRQLLPLPIARVRNCLSVYRCEIESHGVERTLAIATSAVRDAGNGEAFLGEIEWSYGFTTQLLDGAAEASMMARGVAAGRSTLEDTLLVDIGGGSTELVECGGGGRVTRSTSIDVGCVRATERFFATDPPTERELVAAATAVKELLPDSGATTAIGVAGTITTLAALDLGLVEYEPERTHGHRITRAAVGEQLERLVRMTLTERLRVPGLEPGRAPVIVAGLVILHEILDAYGLDAIEASERDILHGAALTAAELPEPEERPVPPGDYICC